MHDEIAPLIETTRKRFSRIKFRLFDYIVNIRL